MKRATATNNIALPLLTPVRRSGSTGSTHSENISPPLGTISVRACVAPRRGTGMGRGAAAISRAFHSLVKRGRGPVLRVAALALLILFTAAYSSGRLGFDVTADEYRVRFARAAPGKGARNMLATSAGQNDNDNDADANERDDDENDDAGAGMKRENDVKDVQDEESKAVPRRIGSGPRIVSERKKEEHHTQPQIPKQKMELKNEALGSGEYGYGSGSFMFSAPRRLPDGRSRVLIPPQECEEWRKIATHAEKLQLYRRHFTSLDFTDWFVFVAMFNEQWHAKHRHARHRPIYVDVAANHARRWSNTYFFDRCMGWDGICVEANPVYHQELRAQRHCHLIDTCVSDMVRLVNFSFTAAYGGVVRDEKSGWGVNGREHATQDKYTGQFNGIHTLTCTTLATELGKRNLKHIDFFSLDVEGYELPVLQGINWDKTTIDVLVVENKRSEIVTFLEEKGFRRVQHVLKDDIYIREGSGYHAEGKFADWLKHLDKSDYRFHLPV